MLNALERSIGSADEHLVLLAPSAASASGFFTRVEVDRARHLQLLRDTQRFRARIYLKDGAVEPYRLSPDGTHRTPEDEKSWHMLLVDRQEQLKACASYLEHDNTVAFDQLRVRNCPLARHPEWQGRLWKAMESELARARSGRLQYVELGGWAVAEESRRTPGPLTLALAVYGFSRRSSGAIGTTTATFRHASSTILKRLGGSRVEVDGTTIPPYYDRRYNCMMEMLRFDSRQPDPKYIGLIDQLRDKLTGVRVVAPPARTDPVVTAGFLASRHLSPRPLLAS